jgi:hypothetical protein
MSHESIVTVAVPYHTSAGEFGDSHIAISKELRSLLDPLPWQFPSYIAVGVVHAYCKSCDNYKKSKV